MNKYRNKKTVFMGIKFHSVKEMLRYQDLSIMQTAGMISDLELQPKFEIIPAVVWNGKKHRARFYIADFMYRDGDTVFVEDVKGVCTAVYTLKRQLFLIRYPEYKFIES